jgi:hypothetical protein
MSGQTALRVNVKQVVCVITTGFKAFRILITKTVWKAVTMCTSSLTIQQFYVLPTECVYVFCVDLRTNSDYFTVQY